MTTTHQGNNSYIVLSRKYRPKTLTDLIGQDVLEKSIRNSIDNKKVPHAFIFHGIRGVGKTTTARILARCLNCVGIDGHGPMTSEPCGVCKSCLAMDMDNHLDVMEIDAASRTGVDDIREIIEASQYMPVIGRYKIFIIDEVHMLSKSAFNALLKTLEEPPAHVKFIFATTEINKVPETILSRCITFNLHPVSNETIAKYLVQIAKLEKFTLEEDAAKIIAMEAEGSVRDSLSILEQAMMISLTEQSVITGDMIRDIVGGAKEADIEELLELVLKAKTNDALQKTNQLLSLGADPYVLYKNMQGVLYRAIVTKVSNAKLVKHDLSNLLYLWQIFLKQFQNMKISTYPEQVFSAVIVIMAHTASFPSIEKLMIPEDSSEITMNKKQSVLSDKVSSIIGMAVNKTTDNTSKVINDVLQKFPGSIASDIE